MNEPKNIRNWTDEVIEEWKARGTKLNAGLSLSEIQSAESILQFKFPTDFIELYQKVNGFSDLDWNEHMFSFWPLERIVEEYKAEGEEGFVGFCDFLISSHSVGFSKNDSGIYKDYDRQQPIASTFREAVSFINNSTGSIY